MSAAGRAATPIAGSGETLRATSNGNGHHLLTADQLAERWQVSKDHVYRLARDGRIPTVRIGRYFRFRLEAIEAWERDGGAASDA